MFALKIVKNCPSQHKALLNAIGGIDPLYSKLMTFYLDNATSHLPHSIVFQIPIIV
jgi:hypothetical protein